MLSDKKLIIEYGFGCMKVMAVETIAKKNKVISTDVFEFDAEDFEPAIENLCSVYDPSIYKKVIVSVSRKKFLSHFFSLPASEKQEIDSMLDLRTLSHEKEINSECIKAYSCTPAFNGHSWIHLFMLQKRLIEPFLDALIDKQFSVSRVSVSSEGLRMWAQHDIIDFANENGIVVLVDVCKTVAECLVLDKGNLLFSRLFSYNGNPISFANGLKQSLGNFEMNFGKCKLNRLYLSGVLNDIDLTMIDIEDIIVQENKSQEQYSFNSLNGFCYETEGFLDFTPEYILEGKRVKVKKYHLYEMVKIVFQLLVIIGVFLFMQVYSLQQKVAKLRRETDKIGAQSLELKKMANELNYFARKRQAYPYFSDVFDDIFSVMPKGLYLISVDIKNDQTISIRGGASNIALVFDFIKKLNITSSFDGIKADYVRKQNSSKGSAHEFYLIGRVI